MSERRKYIIGVDGGGTKTKAVLSNSKGYIIKETAVGSSNIRNVGLEKAVFNISQAIKQLLKGEDFKIVACCVALASLEEEYRGYEKKIKRMLLNFGKDIPFGEIFVISDQLEALWSVGESEYGVVLIAGTGSVAHGWNNGNEAKASGWGFLNDEGSSFWVGQRTLQAVLKDLDCRGPKTLMSKFLLGKEYVKGTAKFMKGIYEGDFVKKVSLISKITVEAAQNGDKIAQAILKEGAKEVVLAAEVVIKKLKFRRKFPVILVGSMFKSLLILNLVKKEISKEFPDAKFIFVKKPVKGAVNFALRKYDVKPIG
ncbi:hypothetical protein J7J81_02945 [bacterium]|nr:hypothetical protein [bacterium]